MRGRNATKIFWPRCRPLRRMVLQQPHLAANVFFSTSTWTVRSVGLLFVLLCIDLTAQVGESLSSITWIISCAVLRVLYKLRDAGFFAAVAAAGRPELAGKPIAVCHGTSHASSNAEISTCNYEARAYGVTKSMWLKEARRLCPNLVVRPYEFDR